MSILVTGGSSFIASHLLNSLKEYNVSFHARSEQKVAHLLSQKFLTPIIGSFSLDTLNNTALNNCNCIIHLAGSFSAASQEELISNNLLTTSTVLELMRIKRIPKIIFISTAAVWGKNLASTANELKPAVPVTDYAHSKFAAECLIKNAFQRGHIKSAFILRPNTIYGYGSKLGIVNSLIEQASQNMKFKIYGDGKQLREPLNIHDLINLIIKCLDSKKLGFNIYGVSGPESLSIIDIAMKVADIFKFDFDYEFFEEEGDKPKSILIDQQKIQNELSWRPAILLEQGLKAIYDEM